MECIALKESLEGQGVLYTIKATEDISQFKVFKNDGDAILHSSGNSTWNAITKEFVTFGHLSETSYTFVVGQSEISYYGCEISETKLMVTELAEYFVELFKSLYNAEQLSEYYTKYINGIIYYYIDKTVVANFDLLYKTMHASDRFGLAIYDVPIVVGENIIKLNRHFQGQQKKLYDFVVSYQVNLKSASGEEGAASSIEVKMAEHLTYMVESNIPYINQGGSYFFTIASENEKLFFSVSETKKPRNSAPLNTVEIVSIVFTVLILSVIILLICLSFFFKRKNNSILNIHI